MNFKRFYAIAKYGNANWKGNFTEEEVAQNAYDYLCEFKESKEKRECTYTIKALMKLLAEDHTEESMEFLYDMMFELCLISAISMKEFFRLPEKTLNAIIEGNRINLNDCEMVGILYKYNNGDLGLWQLDHPEEVIDKIQDCLDLYINRGCSVRGTAKEIADEVEEM